MSLDNNVPLDKVEEDHVSNTLSAIQKAGKVLESPTTVEEEVGRRTNRVKFDDGVNIGGRENLVLTKDGLGPNENKVVWDLGTREVGCKGTLSPLDIGGAASKSCEIEDIHSLLRAHQGGLIVTNMGLLVGLVIWWYRTR